MKAIGVSLAAGLLMVFAAPEARAFCRAHACNRSVPTEGCQIDDRGCVVSGSALQWPRNCLQVGVNEAGSVRHGIGFEQLKTVTEAAFATWTNADCSGGKPALRVEVVGPIACGASEYNSGKGNINLVVFREDSWPYVGGDDALGRTSVWFNANTGELWDADIEINGTAGTLGVDGTTGIDLQSLLTHEAGHVLGLDHSDVAGATMIAGYEATDTSLRTLESDDVEGICAVFPAGTEISTNCAPRGGFSGECGGYIESEPVPPSLPDDGGCGVAEAPLPQASFALATLGPVALFGLRRRGRRDRRRARAATEAGS
jgi:hypothetical protein